MLICSHAIHDDRDTGRVDHLEILLGERRKIRRERGRLKGGEGRREGEREGREAYLMTRRFNGTPSTWRLSGSSDIVGLHLSLK